MKRASRAPSRKRFFHCSPEASLNDTSNETPGHERSRLKFTNPNPPQHGVREPPPGPAQLSIAVASWLVPGLGHLLMGRTGRAIVFFIAVGGLAMVGFQMRGNVFPPQSADPFGTLGFWRMRLREYFICSRVFLNALVRTYRARLETTERGLSLRRAS